MWNQYQNLNGGDGLHYQGGTPFTRSVKLRNQSIPPTATPPHIYPPHVCLMVFSTFYDPSGGVVHSSGRLADRELVLGASPPSTSIFFHRLSQKRRTAKVWFTADNGVSPYHFKCKLDNKRYKRCSSPQPYKHLDHGKHRFKVVATDSRGKADTSPATWSFRLRH